MRIPVYSRIFTHILVSRLAFVMPLLLIVLPSLAATLQLAATGSPAGDVMTKDVLSYAYARLGVQVVFVDLPMRRGFAEVQAGAMDGITASGITAIEKMVKVSVPVTYNDVAVFSIRQQFKVAGYESLRPYSIGIRHQISGRTPERHEAG